LVDEVSQAALGALSQMPASGTANGALARLEGLFDRSTRSDWAMVQRDRERRQFLIMEAGVAVAETEYGAWPMAAGSILILPRGAPHAIRFGRAAMGRVLFADERLLTNGVWPLMPAPAPWASRAQLTPQILHFWEGPRQSAARERMLRELDQVAARLDPRFEIVVTSYLIVVLMDWLEPVLTRRRISDAREFPGRSAELELVDRFRVLVEQRFPSGSTVTDYCKALGVSKSRLTRACAEITGRSPLEMIHDRVLLEAKRELLYADATVIEIAQMLGFSNASYFTRFFARHVGLTPAQFRVQSSLTDETRNRSGRRVKAATAPRSR
jgi:AraC family transcriptional activator of pobA